MAAHGFWMLLVGQLVLVISRAASGRRPGRWRASCPARGVQLGRLNAVTNFGQIVGTTLCGFLLAAVGFQATFAAMAATGAIALAAGLGTQAQPPKPHPRAMCSALSAAAARAIIAYAVMCAYLSALPFSLTMSFYPVLLANYGRGSLGHPARAARARLDRREPAGRALRAHRPQTLWPVVCGVAVAASVGLLPTVNHVVPIAFWLLVVGAGTAAMTLYFQVTISERAGPRSAARRWRWAASAGACRT